MEELVCEICGAAATVHMTLIDHGEKRNKHFCAAHVGSAVPGMEITADGQMVADGMPLNAVGDRAAKMLLTNLRGTVNYIRRHGRVPSSVEELREGMAMEGDGAAVEIKHEELAKSLVWMEKTIGFIEARGRMPKDEEELGTYEE